MNTEPYKPPRMRKLVVHDLDAYQKAIDFQNKDTVPGPYSLTNQINYLLCGSFWNAEELHIAKDYAPFSFGFWFKKNGNDIGMNGGIIYHDQEKTWGVHT